MASVVVVAWDEEAEGARMDSSYASLEEELPILHQEEEEGSIHGEEDRSNLQWIFNQSILNQYPQTR